MIQSIVFDFGNVLGLFDHRITAARLARFCDVSAEQIYARLYGGALETDYETGRLSSSDFLAQVLDLFRLRCPPEVVAEAWSDVFSPNAEILALLPLLKRRHRLLLGSNTNELHSMQFRRQFAGAFRYFDHLVFSHEIGARKPEAAFFQHCQSLAGCAADQCLFIDDLAANVAGARSLGWQGIVYTSPVELRLQLAAMLPHARPYLEAPGMTPSVGSD